MATLAPGGRITRAVLDTELTCLQSAWHTPPRADSDDALLISILGEKDAARLDPSDRAQLACVIRVCRASATLSEAWHHLFAVTRRKTERDKRGRSPSEISHPLRPDMVSVPSQ